jgi:ribonuclease HI
MPWVRATLRGKSILARTRATGELDAHDGRVEVRYNPKDGRMYRALQSNLVVTDPTPLDDSFCGPAAPVEKAAATGHARTPARPKRKEPEAAAVAADGADGVEVWTDGACTGNPGPAGLGIVLTDGDERVEVSEYLGHATNNIAELTAILRALQMVAQDRPLRVHTDSQYSVGVLQKGWKAKANVELIQSIRLALSQRPHTRLVYTPGHAGVELNERADQLARMAVSTRGNWTGKHKLKGGRGDRGGDC